MLAIRTAKSQSEFVTKALGWNRVWFMPPKIWNSEKKVDILLELRIDHQRQVKAISEHLALPKKHPTSPISDLFMWIVERSTVK